jgi:hypothetical protein
VWAIFGVFKGRDDVMGVVYDVVALSFDNAHG